MTYNKRHGGPYDRGSADAYYGRVYNPHCFVGASYSTPLIEEAEMTVDALEAYYTGYHDQIKSGKFKEG